MEIDERESRRVTAQDLTAALRAKGVVGVAATFTDNAGITRVKTVPLDRLPDLAAWGVGTTPSFDVFGFDDLIAVSPDGTTPVGDLRIMPDLDRIVPLAAHPGWAWTPAERHEQTGEPHAACSRSLLRRLVADLGRRGYGMRAAFEVEWVISSGTDDEFVSATVGPGYSLARLGEVSSYARRILEALAEQGISVEQCHPEYAPGQFEVTVAAEDPVAAADTSVLVRETVRGVGQEFGLRTSFSPKVDVNGVGSGGHVHFSLTDGDTNLMAGGEGAAGMTDAGASFTAGVLDHLPALMAVGAPGLASYLRLVPSHWAGVFACWGVENREAAVRVVAGSAGSGAWAANVEVKCFDLLANPYLVLAGVVAAGRSGLESGAGLPDAVDVDPAAWSEDSRVRAGVRRLPETLADSVAAFEADDVVAEAFGTELCRSIVAVRRMEIDTYADASAEEVAAAARWRH